MSATKSEKLDLFTTIWGNVEGNMKQMYAYQQEVSKASIDLFKKQQDVFSSFPSYYNDMGEEMKTKLQEMFSNEDFTINLEVWKEKLSEIASKIQQLNATPSNATTEFLEQSQEEIYTFVKQILEDQNKLQKEAMEYWEKYMNQLIEQQTAFMKKLEEQVKSNP